MIIDYEEGTVTFNNLVDVDTKEPPTVSLAPEPVFRSDQRRIPTVKPMGTPLIKLEDIS